ncbi:MAG: DUF3800 domain-containing protein [Pyrinomonadaceae bacterium]
MLVFVDESGDPGLKIDKGSSPYFVVTMIVFGDLSEAQSTDDHIKALRHSLGMRAEHEFHFNKLSKHLRETFLKEVSQFDFVYFSIVINKRKLTGKGFQFPSSFYKYACKLVCSNAKEVLSDATLVIDGRGSREFKNQLAVYLRKHTNEPNEYPPCIKKVKIKDSKNNNLIQMADMICGAVAREFSGKLDATAYRHLVKQREKYVQLWPK